MFVATVAVIAYVLWWETTQEGMTSGTAWNVPLTYPYLIVPLGMTLIALQYLVIVVQNFSGSKPATTRRMKVRSRRRSDSVSALTIGAIVGLILLLTAGHRQSPLPSRWA